MADQPEMKKLPWQPRRAFFRFCLRLAAAAGSVLLGKKAVETAHADPLPDVPGNELIRMQRDLEAALERPTASRRWVMLVDIRKCVGCQACVVACRAENVTGPEGSYRRVPEAPTGRFPNMTNVFMPTNCVQCDDPPCARAVPAGLIRKRADGIVEFDYTRLRGPLAEAAAAACPYRAVHIDQERHFTDNTPALQRYEQRAFLQHGQVWNRSGTGLLAGAARKCDFCEHLLERGMLPACVSTCIGGAMYFGDAADAASLTTQLLRGSRVIRIHEELGIEPRVFYIEDKLPNTRQYSCATCH